MVLSALTLNNTTKVDLPLNKESKVVLSNENNF